jgi:hypothetical protein
VLEFLPSCLLPLSLSPSYNPRATGGQTYRISRKGNIGKCEGGRMSEPSFPISSLPSFPYKFFQCLLEAAGRQIRKSTLLHHFMIWLLCVFSDILTNS